MRLKAPYILLFLGILWMAAPAVQGQWQQQNDLSISGYVKNFSLGFDLPDPGGAGGEDYAWAVANRLRLNLDLGLGPDISFDAAYDLTPRWQDSALAADSSALSFLDPVRYRIKDFDQQLLPSDDDASYGSFSVFHNLDRFFFTLSTPNLDLYLGRQALAWGSAKIINPTDVIAPYVFNELDQEERLGVDAVRLRVPLGPLSELDLGYVFGEDAEFANSAFFLRRRWYVQQSDVVASAVGFRENLMLGVDLTRALGKAGFYAESAYVFAGALGQRVSGEDYLRVSLGLDTRLTADLYGFAEYHFNGAGNSDPEEYPELFAETAFREGFVYLLGRHYAALGGSWQYSPLTVFSATAFVNLGDMSLSFSPAVEHSLTENLYIAAGASVNVGESSSSRTASGATAFESEFGSYSDFYYFSAKYYF